EGAVALVTLNRPEKRNALNDALVAALKGALRDADARDEVRAVVLTGAGADFCSGADLSALQKISEASVEENLEDARKLLELYALIRSVRVPVVAAVRGRALAGGCGLATACDIVLAASSARFGYPEVQRGFVPALVLNMLKRAVGEKVAFDLAVTGRLLAAPDAAAVGLISRVFPDAELAVQSDQVLRRLGSMSSSALAFTKQQFYRLDGMDFGAGIRLGADVNAASRTTPDFRTALTAFLKQ